MTNFACYHRCCLSAICLLLLSNLCVRGDERSAPIRLHLDASEAPRGILHAKLEIPVKPGAATLFFPKWIPGTHGPVGSIASLAGLETRVQGKSIPWRRDEVDMFAFHVNIPNGADTLEVALDHVAGGRRDFMGSPSPHITVIRWNDVLLYPKGKPQQEIKFQASLRLPDGWQSGTALPIESRDGAEIRFAPVTLETLIDSPVISGRYFREIPIGTDHGIPHFLELACDSPEGLDVPADVKTQHERLVAEAGALFGARHYRSYRFLVALGKNRGGGLEHHESSDNGGPERFMVDKPTRNPMAFLLPHEFTHSWNGKYRRPAGLVTSDFQEPEKTRTALDLRRPYRIHRHHPHGALRPIDARRVEGLHRFDCGEDANPTRAPLAPATRHDGRGPDEFLRRRLGIEEPLRRLLRRRRLDLAGGRRAHSPACKRQPLPRRLLSRLFRRRKRPARSQAIYAGRRCR